MSELALRQVPARARKMPTRESARGEELQANGVSSQGQPLQAGRRGVLWRHRPFRRLRASSVAQVALRPCPQRPAAAPGQRRRPRPLRRGPAALVASHSSPSSTGGSCLARRSFSLSDTSVDPQAKNPGCLLRPSSRTPRRPGVRPGRAGCQGFDQPPLLATEGLRGHGRTRYQRFDRACPENHHLGDPLESACDSDQDPNQRARRVEANTSFSRARSCDGPTRRAVGAGPPRKLASTLPTIPPPNSM